MQPQRRQTAVRDRTTPCDHCTCLYVSLAFVRVVPTRRTPTAVCSDILFPPKSLQGTRRSHAVRSALILFCVAPADTVGRAEVSVRKACIRSVLRTRVCLNMPLVWGTVSDKASALHGRIVEVLVADAHGGLFTLPALHSVLCGSIQRTVSPTIWAPVATTDLLEYVWPRLTSIDANHVPFSTGLMVVGTIGGSAPPHFNFHHAELLADRLHNIQAVLATHEEVPLGHYVHVRLHADATLDDSVTVRNIQSVEYLAFQAAQNATLPSASFVLTVTTDNRGSVSVALPRDQFPAHVTQQVHALRYLALRELIACVQSGQSEGPPTTLLDGQPCVYAFVEVVIAEGPGAGCFDSAVFKLPVRRTNTVRAGHNYSLRNLNNNHYNGHTVAVLADQTSLQPPMHTWSAVAALVNNGRAADVPTIERWAVRVAAPTFPHFPHHTLHGKVICVRASKLQVFEP